jgi:5-methylcytosine-specific restriction endonuclease McrA
MSKKININIKLLSNDYIVNKLSMNKIAKAYGVSLSTISRNINQNNIYKNSRLILKKYCIVCHKEVHRKNKFGYCKSCWQLGDKNPCYTKGEWITGIRGKIRVCVDCGNKIFGQKRCYKCCHKLSNNPNWKKGISFEPYPIGWNENYIEKIRQRDNYTCQNCGKLQSSYIKKLHVHHIDYNKQNLSLDNLISLCISCHMKTNYNREYWIKFLTKKDINEL